MKCKYFIKEGQFLKKLFCYFSNASRNIFLVKHTKAPITFVSDVIVSVNCVDGWCCWKKHMLKTQAKNGNAVVSDFQLTVISRWEVQGEDSRCDDN